MNIDTLITIIASAKEALAERRRLEKMHTAYIATMKGGGMSRARTTTYNARAASAAQRATSFETDIRRLANGEPIQRTGSSEK